MENNFYRWENDFSCIILSLKVFTKYYLVTCPIRKKITKLMLLCI